MVTLPATIETEQQSTLSLVNDSRAITISSLEDRRDAEQCSKALKAASDKWDELTGPSKAAAYEAYKKAQKLHDDLIAELDGARKALKQKCIAWDNEQERIRREEQRRLEEEARKRAEEEQIALAAMLEAQGDNETAEAVICQPVVAPCVAAPKPAFTPSRLTVGRSNWSAEVIDLLALVAAVAAGKAPISYIQANTVALNQAARAMKHQFNVPGVKAIETKV